ncbi:MAG: glycine oxidase ThiO [gamma proteobacterium endosymbiont of Lamellibrachia anaximandri]|nr:glycine oxidase ThiO [gamma proteobacterium endosymbiont of Lamellibrachia anaximandri]
MSDCLIIGGGIIGMLTAWELQSTGMRVTLIERRETGRESSWAGGGIVSPLYPWRYADSVTALAGWSQSHYTNLARSLTQDSGIDPEYTQNGLLILEPGDEKRATAWAKETGQTLQLLNEPTTRECEPALATTAETAVWMPQVAQIRNPRLVKATRLAITPLVKIIEDAEVTELLVRDGRITGIKTGGGRIEADRVVVCAGAWSGRLLQAMPVAPDIAPVRGQMILFKGQPGDVSRIVLHENRYVIPRRDGRVLVGSTLEHSDFKKTTSNAARDELEKYAIQHFPVLEDAEVEHHWAGLRPGSPHGIPYIGPVPEIKGLYVNSGHYRNGVVLAPASARLMADVILEREPILDPRPYAVDAPRED